MLFVYTALFVDKKEISMKNVQPTVKRSVTYKIMLFFTDKILNVDNICNIHHVPPVLPPQIHEVPVPVRVREAAPVHAPGAAGRHRRQPARGAAVRVRVRPVSRPHAHPHLTSAPALQRPHERQVQRHHCR